MAQLVSAYQISKSFASKELFKKISFGIDDQQSIGLIGPNGAGKSTLLKIIAGKISADDGKISYAQGLKIGFLEQKPQFTKAQTIYEELIEQASDPYDGVAIALAFELIKKLSLDQTAQAENTVVTTLSGGWQKRVALARELMKQPQLLLLDEPTNHLDIQSILWLEEFIQRERQMSFLIVTHDRAFLQTTCRMIFDLDPKNPDGLIKSQGTYADFLETKRLLLDGQKRLEEKRRNTMMREKEWLARGPQARLTKQKARQDRAHSLIAEVDKLENKNSTKKVDFDFSSTGSTPKKLIELKNVSKSYTAHPLFQNLSGLIRPKSRIGLLGANGCGKSTLIKILMNQENPSSGEVFINPDIQINYFQQGKETLNVNQTVLKVICPEGDYVHFQGQPVFARSYLSRFYFNTYQMDMPVSRLSGGEQSRLLLAKLMLTQAHVLILDEPTNDLDVETLDVLSECLEEFPGALILVSHDRYFLDQNSNEIWAFTEDDQGTILKFADFNQWQNWYDDKQVKNTTAPTTSASPLNTASSTSNNNISAEGLNPSKGTSNKKLSYKEGLEYEKIESVIAEKEKTLEKLKVEMSSPDVISNYNKLSELGKTTQQLELDIVNLYERWQELESKLKG